MDRCFRFYLILLIVRIINIINLDGAFGKEINNLDLSKVLSKDEIRKVILTFHENGLIRIPGQKLKLKEEIQKLEA